MINCKLVHIPKTGGRSMIKTLGRDIIATSDNTFLKRHYPDLNLDKDVFTFAFVRNPYDRLVSAFYFLHKLMKLNLTSQTVDNNFFKCTEHLKNKTFEEFILDSSRGLNYAAENNIFFRPQNYFIPNGADFIGRFENIDEDFKTICSIIKVKHKKLLKYHKSNHDHYELYYTNNKIKEIVRKIYNDDFILYNYE